MTKRSKIDLPPDKWAVIGAVGAIALGIQFAREMSKSPAERTEERRRNAGRNALRREYEARLQAAWKIDAARWRQFEEDPQAQAALEAAGHVPIIAEAVDAEVTYERGDNFGHAWERVTAKHAGETACVFIDHDGGSWITYASAAARYRACFLIRHGYVVIGEGDGPASDEQVRTAQLLAAMQVDGHFPGIISIARPWRFKRLEQHFAAYARARGWPEERDGEDRRIRRAFSSHF